MKLPKAIFVLHETGIDVETLEDYMADGEFLGSYHAVITIQGNIIYFTPPDMKAFAASDSIFEDPETNELESINGSVDDFAYHCALETPESGRDPSIQIHAGYSRQQYKALAWLLKATGINLNRFVKHGELKSVPSNEPRCFNMEYFMNVLLEQNNEPSINLGSLEL